MHTGPDHGQQIGAAGTSFSMQYQTVDLSQMHSSCFRAKKP